MSWRTVARAGKGSTRLSCEATGRIRQPGAPAPAAWDDWDDYPFFMGIGNLHQISGPEERDEVALYLPDGTKRVWEPEPRRIGFAPRETVPPEA